MKKNLVVILILFILISLFGCGDNNSSIPVSDSVITGNGTSEYPISLEYCSRCVWGTATPQATVTPSPTPTVTLTPTLTVTPAPTQIPTATITPTATVTPSPTITPSPLPTASGSDIVYITDSGDKYHRYDCQYLYNSSISMTRAEAIAAGYTACSVCNP